MNLTIVLSDLQLPYHHVRALNAVCTMLADRASDITEVHQIGDFFDFCAISQWSRGTPKEDGTRLQKEIDIADKVMTDIGKAYPGLKTRIKGNHDDRLDKYLSTQARGLRGLRVLDYDTLTLAAQHGWETKAEPYTLAPRTVAVHGLAVRARSGYTAHAHLDRLDGNVVHGHTHRAGLVYRTLSTQQRWAMEVGCLMDRRQASYLPCGAADWQLGFAALYHDQTGVTPTLVGVDPGGSFVFEGRRYKP